MSYLPDIYLEAIQRVVVVNWVEIRDFGSIGIVSDRIWTFLQQTFDHRRPSDLDGESSSSSNQKIIWITIRFLIEPAGLLADY